MLSHNFHREDRNKVPYNITMSASTIPESQVIAATEELATKDGNAAATSFMTLVDAAASQLDSAPSSKPEETGVVNDALSTKSSPPSSGSSVTSSIADHGNDEKKLSFAEQLMSILDDEANYSHVLQWMPDGKSFTIINPKKFTQVEMPRLFNIRNMSSFVRKLTRWGFSRVHERETMNSDIFKHPQFQKGERELCSEIRCGASTSRSSSASSTSSSASSTMMQKASLEVIKAFNASSQLPPRPAPRNNSFVVLGKGPLPPASSAAPASGPASGGAVHQMHHHRPSAALYPRDSLSSVDQHLLQATVETIRLEREKNLLRMLEARRQHPQSSFLAATAHAEQLLRLERAQHHHIAALRGSGYPALY